MSLIEAIGITHTYDGRYNVLDGVDLTVEKGEFISVLGASGSGKSTLLSILGGIEKPTEGRVLLDGTDITRLKERDLAVLRRTKLSFVFQFFNLAPYLTLEQNVLVPVFLNGKNKNYVRGRLDELLRFLGIDYCRNRLPGKLSGGEQQRAAIARGLICNPDIIFLDEPTGNLDSRNGEEIMKLLSAVNKESGTTVVQVTHSEANARYGSRIIRLADGKAYSEEISAGDGVRK